MKKEDREPRCRICIGALFRGRAPFSQHGNTDFESPDPFGKLIIIPDGTGLDRSFEVREGVLRACEGEWS